MADAELCLGLGWGVAVVVNITRGVLKYKKGVSKLKTLPNYLIFEERFGSGSVTALELDKSLTFSPRSGKTIFIVQVHSH